MLVQHNFLIRSFAVSVDMHPKASCESRSVNSVKRNMTASLYTYWAICFIVPHLSGTVFFLVVRHLVTLLCSIKCWSFLMLTHTILVL